MARVKEMYQSVKQRVKKSSPPPTIVATPAIPQVTDTVTQLAGPRYSEHTPREVPTSLSSLVSADASAPAKPPAPSNAPALADASEAIQVRRASSSKEEFPHYNELLPRGPEHNVPAAPAGYASSELPPYTSSPRAALTKDIFQQVEQSGLDLTSPLDLQLMAETYLDSEGQELVDHESISNHSDMIQASRYTGRSSMRAPKLSLPLRSKEVDSGFFGSPESSAALDGTFDVASAIQSRVSSKSTSPTTKSDVAADSKPPVPPRSADRPNYSAPEVLPNVRSARRSSWGISQSLNMFKDACTTWRGNPSRVTYPDHGTFHAPPENRKTRAPGPFTSSIHTSGVAKRKREEDDDVSPITPLDGKTDLATPERPRSQDEENIVKSLYGTHYRESSFVPKVENMDLIVPMKPEDIHIPSSSWNPAGRRNPSGSSSLYSDRDGEYHGQLNDDLRGLLLATDAGDEDDAQHAAVSDLPAEFAKPKNSPAGSVAETTSAVMDNNGNKPNTRQPDVLGDDEEGASEVERLFDAVFVGWRANDGQQDTVTAIQSTVVDEPANADRLATDHDPQQPSTPCKEAISSTTASVQNENSSPNIETPDSWTSKARKLASRKSKLWSTWKVAPGKSVKVSVHPTPASGTGEAEVETEYDSGDHEGGGE